MLKSRDVLEEGVVAAGRLGSALDDVPSNEARPRGASSWSSSPLSAASWDQSCPQAAGANRERRVSNATGDNDVGACPKCLGDSASADVRVGGQGMEAKVSARFYLCRG